MEYRSLPVPDGLVGKRVDAALAALLGFSRSFAAEVIQGGGVTLDGQVLGKSDRLHADGWLEVHLHGHGDQQRRCFSQRCGGGGQPARRCGELELDLRGQWRCGVPGSQCAQWHCCTEPDHCHLPGRWASGVHHHGPACDHG